MIKLLYQNKRVEKQFNPKYQDTWRYPKKVKLMLISLSSFFDISKSLYDIAMEPALHLEKLKGNRQDEWSIRAYNTGYRITFIPCDDSGNVIVTGDIMSRCKTIHILTITEVSNHYE